MAMMFRGLGKPTDQLVIQLGQPSDPFGFGAKPDYSMSIAPMAQPMQADKFGFRDVIGILGEALGGALGHGPGAYTQGKIQARELQQKALLDQQGRNADWQDWVRKEQYKAANPGPVNNDTANDYNFYYQTLGKDAADAWARGQTDPVVSIPLPGGQTYIGPRSGLGAATKGGGQASVGSAAPQGAIDYLRANPSAADQFDAKYGKGSAASILGGGGSNATGGFPR